jgi:hypothetical protein
VAPFGEIESSVRNSGLTASAIVACVGGSLWTE